MTSLPKKLSDRILLALADLEKCEADPRYHIDMGARHTPLPNGACAVCFAGAVMAKTYRVPRHSHTYPIELGSLIGAQLQELSGVRSGIVPDSGWYSGDEYDALWRAADHTETRVEWKLHMLDIVGRLQSEGR